MDDMSELLNFVDTNWAESPYAANMHNYWQHLYQGLMAYNPPPKSMKLNNMDRKWELVSAYQKAIRRGDVALALKFVSAMDSVDDATERTYFWRRIGVIVVEDVGPSNPTLCLFVIACQMIFTPAKYPTGTYKLWCYLTDLMCGEQTRSRVYNVSHIIHANYSKVDQDDLDTFGKEFIGWLIGIEHEMQAPTDPYLKWLKKNNWRADGLLQYCKRGCLFIHNSIIDKDRPPYTMLHGLPSYCYDMYTRVGKQMLKALPKVSSTIAEIVQNYTPATGSEVTVWDLLGEALFFVEGGRIKNEMNDPRLYLLEQQMIAASLNVTVELWYRLREEMEKELIKGSVDGIRLAVLNKTYPK